LEFHNSTQDKSLVTSLQAMATSRPPPLPALPAMTGGLGGAGAGQMLFGGSSERMIVAGGLPIAERLLEMVAEAERKGQASSSDSDATASHAAGPGAGAHVVGLGRPRPIGPLGTAALRWPEKAKWRLIAGDGEGSQVRGRSELPRLRLPERRGRGGPRPLLLGLGPPPFFPPRLACPPLPTGPRRGPRGRRRPEAPARTLPGPC